MVKYVTYNERKPMELVRDTIEDRVLALLEDFNEDIFKSLCGTLCYVMLCNIPEFDLVNGKNYTIEMICYNTPTSISLSVHKYMDCLSDIAVYGATSSKLSDLLQIDELFSVIDLCNTEMRRIYCVFVEAYAFYIGNASLLQTAKDAVSNSLSLQALRNMFGG